MNAAPPVDARSVGPADLVDPTVTPELLVCTALVRSGLVDGAGASIVLSPSDRIGLAATDDTFARVAETQFSAWEGPGPEVVESRRHLVVDDLHAQGSRWPLTTPYAATTPMRALATFPMTGRHGALGLFAVYRAAPGPFASLEVAQLLAAAATIGMLADTRFDRDQLTVLAQAPTLAIAVGMLVSHLGVGPDDALSLLRAKAFARSVPAPSLARDLASRTVRVEDLLGRPDGA